MRKYTPENIVNLDENEIFVFGSNEAGIHGAGAGSILKSDGSVENTISISSYKIHTFCYIGSHWVIE